MRNRLIDSVVALMAVLVVLPLALAQAPAQSGAANSPPDLSGIWTRVRAGQAGRWFLQEDPPPLQPWAMEIYNRNRVGVPKDESALDELDPSTFCFPRSLTRAMGDDPFQLIQFPNRIVMIFEGMTSSQVRRIYIDGRGHPEHSPDGWFGHSIGKWEEDTLVVDTVGLNGRAWIDNRGILPSDALHVVERIRRVNQDSMEIDFLLEDRKAFTKPVAAKRNYRLSPDLELFDIVLCEDHLQIGKHWMHDPNKR